MAAPAFFSDEARQAIKRAIETIEQKTSAEVVVHVARTAAAYRDVSERSGFWASFVMLLILLFHPMEFDIILMPLFILLAWFGTARLVAGVWSIKRRLLSKTRRQAAVDLQAAHAFLTKGVSGTRDRTGILVYVCAFERCVSVIADRGVPPGILTKGNQSMSQALENDLDFTAFVKALESWAPVLKKALPRRADDVNELANEVQHS